MKNWCLRALFNFFGRENLCGINLFVDVNFLYTFRECNSKNLSFNIHDAGCIDKFFLYLEKKKLLIRNSSGWIQGYTDDQSRKKALLIWLVLHNLHGILISLNKVSFKN